MLGVCQNISATVDSRVNYHILLGLSSRLKLIAKELKENYNQKFTWSTENSYKECISHKLILNIYLN